MPRSPSTRLLETRAPSEPAALLRALRADLAWLAARLRDIVDRDRHRRELGPPEEYRGLYVGDDEVDAITAELSRTYPSTDGAPGLSSPIRKPAADTRLDRVAQCFGLSDEERLVLVIALAPHLDRAFDRVFAYVNDDITRRRPTVGLAIEVLGDSAEEALVLRELFRADAPLLRQRLVNLAEDGSFGTTPLISRYLELDPHVAEVILGYRQLDARLRPFARLVHEGRGSTSRRSELMGALVDRPASRVYVGGRWGGEKLEAIRSTCAGLGLSVIEVTTARIPDAVTARETASLAIRDGRLLGSGVAIVGWESQTGDDPVLKEIACEVDAHRDYPHPLFLVGRAPYPEVSIDHLDLHYNVNEPSYGDRVRMWSEYGRTEHAVRLASSFKLGGREIRAAGRMATSLARLGGREQPGLTELQVAARLQARPRLSTLAHKLTPHFTWADIVLPDDRLEQLRELVAQASFQNVVYEEWGLGEKLTLGRGVVSLFAGPSGTGKTMAAEVIAGELGLDMYKIDLSGLVSKYIGETEKNLARVFDEAADSNAVLFFDEADAVFGKRSEVRDSHDRYANIEVGYLLQRLEEHEGVVVLATNLRANIDDAFLRRMRSVIEFPFPEEDDRARIWARSLGHAPLQDDVDLGFMAREYRVSGGNIRNIVLLGAFLAASAGEPIGMRQLVQAAKREYQKLGRLVTSAEPD